MKYHILFIISLIFITDLCDTVSQLFLKHPINLLDVKINNLRNVFTFVFSLLGIARVWLGGLLSLLSLFIWLFVLSKTDLNLAFSLDSMRYILITAASVIMLKERVGWLRWTGILCVVVGITLVSIGS